MKDVIVIGYFLDVDGDLDCPDNVFVVLDDGNEFPSVNRTIYAPIGQHSTAHKDYIAECKEITLEQYLKASGNFYTPKEYIKRDV